MLKSLLRGELNIWIETIYIADDEINICIIKSFLVKEGFEVETFNDGRSILGLNTNQSDMLVIDIMMPEIDGYSLCSLIRQKSSGQ